MLSVRNGSSGASASGSDSPNAASYGAGVTAASKGNILFIDDDAAMRELVEDTLDIAGFEVTTAPSGREALAVLKTTSFDAVVTDLQLGDLSGIDVCRQLTEDRGDVPVIVLTGFGSMDSAVSALRAGAYDFITKPVDPERLALHVERAVRHRKLGLEVAQLRERLGRKTRIDGLIGASKPMDTTRDLMDRVARTDVTVLITGETGTGKEVVARGIHDASDRRDGAFVAVNCAAMPESLLESELFGHLRGAFTNARADRKGLFREATGGTIFLDEIGEMPVHMQVKLLRALQERKVRPVGGDREASFDARILAATNRDLTLEVAEGRFREDLLYRLRVVNIDLSPLRQRGSDVILLAAHFIRRFSERYNVNVKGLSEGAARALMLYQWPGNVRELENAIDRAVALARLDQIGVDDLPPTIHARSAATDRGAVELVPLEVVERRHVLGILREVGGNKSVAADILGIDRKTLYRRLKAWG